MNDNRKLVILVLLTVIFGVAIIVWYFFGVKPAANPSIDSPTNPFGSPAIVVPGREFVNNKTTETEGTQNENERIPAEERVLTQIWEKPTAGYAFVTREIILEATTTTATSTDKKTTKLKKKTVEYILFVDRLTGHMYGYDIGNGALFQVSDTTIPGVYDAYITNNGRRVFMRYLDTDGETIKTLTATIPAFIAGSSPNPLTYIGSLQDNVTSFAVSSSSNSFSYLVPNPQGSTVYTTNSTGKTSLLTSPFREWSLVYGGEAPYMTTKPSAYLPGFTLSLPSQSYVLGNRTGLLALPNNKGDTVLASMWSSSGLATFMLSRKDASIKVLPIKTLASKCAWLDSVRAVCGVPIILPSGDQGLPDDWFQGTSSFSDDLYLTTNEPAGYSVESNTGSLIFPLGTQSGQPFDMTHLQINPPATSLIFTNKVNGSLWLISLSKIILTQ